MRLFEIINTPLSAELSYDEKHHKLRLRKKPSLKLDYEDGRVITVPNRPPKLTLRLLHRIKFLRRKYLEQKARTTKLRGLMYGGSLSVKQTEIDTAQAELQSLQAQLSAEIQAAELDQSRKDKLAQMAMRHIRR